MESVKHHKLCNIFTQTIRAVTDFLECFGTHQSDSKTQLFSPIRTFEIQKSTPLR